MLTTDRLEREPVIRFQSVSPLKQVRIDPAHGIALVVPPPSPSGQGLTNEVRKLEYGAKDARPKELPELARKTGHTGIGDWFRLGLMLYDRGQYADALEAFQTLAKLAASPASSPDQARSAVWRGHRLDLLGRREEALACYREPLAKWTPDMVITHDQWKMQVDRKWIEERLNSPFQRK